MECTDYDRDWAESYAQERERLLAALGEVTGGGIVENIQHIGATSVPGVIARPCVDMGLSVWPFPLEPQQMDTLAALGYALVPGYEDAPEQRLRHASGAWQLFIVEVGSERWMEYLLVRDYLRNEEAAREGYSARKQTWAEREGDTASEGARAEAFKGMLEEAREWWVR